MVFRVLRSVNFLESGRGSVTTMPDKPELGEAGAYEELVGVDGLLPESGPLRELLESLACP